MAEIKYLSEHYAKPEFKTLEGYKKLGGYEQLAKALKMEPQKIIDEVKASGLRGRGGAGFATGVKWGFLPNNGEPRYLLCNADESEPGTFKDRVMMERAPHQLIEGMLISAFAIKSNKAYIYIRGEYMGPAAILEKAIAEAKAAGLIGKNILGSGFDCDLDLYLGAGAYICGEETGMISSLEGLKGQPKLKPPFPAVQGYLRKPTIVNNVETLAAVVPIIRDGAVAYRKYGTEKSAGTKLFSISGNVNKPGTYEVPLGYPLMDLINNECGGLKPGRKLKAVVPGGSSAPVITAEEAQKATLDYECLAQMGTMLGSGAIIVIDDSNCMVDVLSTISHFYHHESCGQCTPCREGTGWMERIIHGIVHGHGNDGDLDLLLKIADQMKGRTICALSDAAALPVLSFVTKFKDEFEYFIREKNRKFAEGRSMLKSTLSPSEKEAQDLKSPAPEMVTISINGQDVEVKKGATIMEAFYQNKIDIAYYCWHPGLSIAGVCRLCMVEIEGNPRLQIACNTQVTPGMKVNNNSPKVKDAVKWGLDFHLINHPLDCPICDQAGECGLQDQYMKYGQYDSEMGERKVKKHKVVDLGPRVVLDSERCILCARCVRFTDEVSKSHELGIFNRGDRAEVGTFDGKPLANNYSVNTVDICPVGALTSRDFRFRQRVWFLKEAETICTGCSTGCNVKVSYNKEGLFRVKPVYNPDVNGHWMCDSGRDAYKFVNKEARLLDAKVVNQGKVEHMQALELAKRLGATLKGAGKSAALVLTGVYTSEEYEAIVSYFKNEVGSTQIFHWINNPETFESFDGLLGRGDKNPNTRGLMEILKAQGIGGSWKELTDAVGTGAIKTVVVAGPENQANFPDMKVKIMELSKASKLVWLSTGKNAELEALGGDVALLPVKSYIEKSGTFVNYAGRRQQVNRVMTVVPGALSLTEVVAAMKGEDIQPSEVSHAGFKPNKVGTGRVHNEFTLARGVW